MPGDLPDLHSLPLEALDNRLGTLTQCRLGLVPHDSLHKLCDAYPRPTCVLWRSTLIDAAIQREWLLNLGQREAYARLAHLLCELVLRLIAVGRVTDGSCIAPITPLMLADAMGRSPVHVNRTLSAAMA